MEANLKRKKIIKKNLFIENSCFISMYDKIHYKFKKIIYRKQLIKEEMFSK